MTTAERARLLGDDRAPQSALVVGAAPESRTAPRGISPLSPSAPLPSGRDSIDDHDMCRDFDFGFDFAR